MTKFLLHIVLWHFKDIRLEQKSLVPDVFTNYQHSEQHNSKMVSHKKYSSSILFQYSLFADISYFSQKIIQKHKACEISSFVSFPLAVLFFSTSFSLYAKLERLMLSCIFKFT